MTSLKGVEEIWLFGSSAREEADEGSDVDVLMVCSREELPNSLTEDLSERFGENIDISHYSYSGLARLIAQRALFAWHLRREGIPLERGTDQLEGMLASMEPYDGHLRDLGVLKAVFDDAVVSLRKDGVQLFDFGVVGTVVRNAAIIMHDLFGSWDFSPAAPVRLALVPEAPPLPIDTSLYEYLCACRRASERGMCVENQDALAPDDWGELLDPIRPWLVGCIGAAAKKGKRLWA